MAEENISQWNNRFAFLMAMMGSAIGVGTIWRFPNVIYSNGGSSFLIPYICAFLILGIFMGLFENTLGLKFRRSRPRLFMKLKINLMI